MKCDELEEWYAGQFSPSARVYGASEVDAAIDELKTEHHRERHEYIEMVATLRRENAELKDKLMPCLNGDCILTCEVVEKYGKENAELKQKLESVQASMYADVVDANMENRRLKRALYKVCDNWAVCEMDYWRKCLEHYEDYFNVRTDEDLTEEKCERMIDNWRKVAHNCRAKAEEYK